MTSLLIKDCLLNGNVTDVFIKDGIFESFDANQSPENARVLHARGRLAILPPFYNSHTHASMAVMRGFADDYDLFTWLNKYIWPTEAKLTAEDIDAGARLAMLEMIKGGTVAFNDMYFRPTVVAQAAIDMGIRATVGLLYICDPTGNNLPFLDEFNAEILDMEKDLPDTIHVGYAPHAVYTVREHYLRDIAEKARSENRLIHIHASETKKEVDDCMAEHNGMTPVKWLDECRMLTDKTILAHCTHLTDKDRDLIYDRKSVISHIPTSNLKLVSGICRLTEARKRGCRLALGTDGPASNNSLSMFSEMKFAAMLGKYVTNDPSAADAPFIFDMATRQSALALGIDAGRIEIGAPADAMLIDMDHPLMACDYQMASALVYAADTSVVDSVICNGRVLMEHGIVEGEEEIIAKAKESVKRIKAL